MDHKGPSAEVCLEGGLCGKIEALVEGINFGKCTFACKPVCDVTTVQQRMTNLIGVSVEEEVKVMQFM